MINYSSELAIQCNELRVFMQDKIPDYYHDVSHSTGNKELDIVIFNPLERQINGMPTFEHDSIANHVFESVIQIRDHTLVGCTWSMEITRNLVTSDQSPGLSETSYSNIQTFALSSAIQSLLNISPLRCKCKIILLHRNRSTTIYSNIILCSRLYIR